MPTRPLTFALACMLGLAGPLLMGQATTAGSGSGPGLVSTPTGPTFIATLVDSNHSYSFDVSTCSALSIKYDTVNQFATTGAFMLQSTDDHGASTLTLMNVGDNSPAVDELRQSLACQDPKLSVQINFQFNNFAGTTAQITLTGITFIKHKVGTVGDFDLTDQCDPQHEELVLGFTGLTITNQLTPIMKFFGTDPNKRAIV